MGFAHRVPLSKRAVNTDVRQKGMRGNQAHLMSGVLQGSPERLQATPSPVMRFVRWLEKLPLPHLKNPTVVRDHALATHILHLPSSISLQQVEGLHGSTRHISELRTFVQSMQTVIQKSCAGHANSDSESCVRCQCKCITLINHLPRQPANL